jgi:hypothetical protein
MKSSGILPTLSNILIPPLQPAADIVISSVPSDTIGPTLSALVKYPEVDASISPGVATGCSTVGVPSASS